VQVTEVAPEEAGPVLQAYVRSVPSTRRFFTAAASAPTADFVAEAHRHPVFRIAPYAGAASATAATAVPVRRGSAP